MYGISRISEPDLRAVRFANKIEEQKLNGSVIREMEVDLEISCHSESADERRQSYNFRTIKGDSEKFMRQLSDSIDSLDLLTLLRIIISFTEE